MRKEILLLVLAMLLVCPLNAALTPDIYCLDDEVYFQNADVFEFYVVDTPENSKYITVNGDVEASLWLYENVTVEFNKGNIRYISLMDSSRIIFNGGSSEFIGVQKNAVAHLYGGDITNLSAWGSSEVHFYGYGFDVYDTGKLGLEVGSVSGFWQDGTPFDISLNSASLSGIENPKAVDHLYFHEIPEPASLLFLDCGLIFLRRKK